MTSRSDWPALPPEEWAPTRRTLHLCAQMLGKLKLALVPPQPEWQHTALLLTPHGWTTGPMPGGGQIVSGDLDIVEGALQLSTPDGTAAVGIADDRSVADIWHDFRAALAALGVEAEIWEKPQEMADTTLFSANISDRTVNLEQAQRFHRILSLTHAVLEEFRSPFFGRTGIQFWWGGFDYTVLLFSGRPADVPPESGYILRHDLDAEHLNAGFWPGSDTAPPSFYAYLVPRPKRYEEAIIRPDAARWVEAMGEWVLPYDDLRSQDDPARVLLDFLTSIRRVAFTLGGWDEKAHTYEMPPPPPHR